MSFIESVITTKEETQTGISEAVKGFKQMQIALLIFASISSIAILISAISLIKNK